MKKIVSDDAETKSADVIASNIGQLKLLFPEAFTEGKVDFEVLKQVLGGAVDEREEKYGLNWHGKRRARQIALTPSLGTLRPCPEESVDWETTQNLMIEGDNLEVLKLLQKSYVGKVKLIYIDPPYNTGKDFVYPDNFQDNIKNYLEVTGQVNEEGRKLSSNTEASGRFHTNWLNMMYPRLKLARNFLRQDRVLLISVDDEEVDNLRKLCDEILGEENIVAALVWDRNRKNDARYFSVGHEYMIVYFKDESFMSDNPIMFRAPKEGVEEIRTEFERLKESCKSDWVGIRAGLLKYYSTFDKDDPRQPLARFTKVDEKGPYRDDGNINWPGGDGPRYQVLHRTTGRPCKLPVSGWRYPTPERFWEEVAKGRIVFGEDETTVPGVRTNLFENNDQVMGSVQYSYAQTVANQFIGLFDGKRVFDNPKPTDDLKRLAAYMTGSDDLVLDFFAGSGSFGHALMALNASDGGSRRFILVQLPEPTRSKKVVRVSKIIDALLIKIIDGLFATRRVLGVPVASFSGLFSLTKASAVPRLHGGLPAINLPNVPAKATAKVHRGLMHGQLRGSRPQLELAAVAAAAMAKVAADRQVHGERATTMVLRQGLIQRTTAVPLCPRSLRRLESKQAQNLLHRDLSANSVEIYAWHDCSSLDDATARRQ